MDGQLKSTAESTHISTYEKWNCIHSYRIVYFQHEKRRRIVQFHGQKHVFSVGVLRAWLEGVEDYLGKFYNGSRLWILGLLIGYWIFPWHVTSSVRATGESNQNLSCLGN